MINDRASIAIESERLRQMLQLEQKKNDELQVRIPCANCFLASLPGI